MTKPFSVSAAVPKPSRRNPFKAGGQPARQFDHMLKLYAEGRRDILRLGPARCMGNNMAVAFWRGYDSIPRTPLPTSPAQCPTRYAPLTTQPAKTSSGG